MLPVKTAGAIPVYESFEAIPNSYFLVILLSVQDARDEINSWLDIGKFSGLFRRNLCLVFCTLRAAQKVMADARKGRGGLGRPRA
ncbi:MULTISPECIES: hypothetical protein [unclassified Bradyrhizobium]|uniref:hypothetical protein n=1 Tax=unclassified Bradyrhizobium TaxID=2631580 RepID=UPI002FEFD86D